MKNEKVYFVVESFVIDDGRKLKKYEMDEDGYYCGVPVAVVGTVSRNNTMYSSESVTQCINGNTAFRKVLEEGALIGEWGHPIVDMKSDYGLYRLSIIDPTREAVSYRKVYLKRVDDLGLDIVFADMKPSGPYGKFFKERMDDPTLNCASSLRAFSRQRVDPATRVIKRDVVQLITFDTGVAGGGFKQASKRYGDTGYTVASSEAYALDVVENVSSPEVMASIESIVDSELNDIFKSKEVKIGSMRMKVDVTGKITEGGEGSVIKKLLRR